MLLIVMTMENNTAQQDYRVEYPGLPCMLRLRICHLSTSFNYMVVTVRIRNPYVGFVTPPPCQLKVCSWNDCLVTLAYMNWSVSGQYPLDNTPGHYPSDNIPRTTSLRTISPGQYPLDNIPWTIYIWIIAPGPCGG